jgi:GAF domain-containing protein
MKEDNKNKRMLKSNYGMGSGNKIENNDILSLKKRILDMLSNSSLKEISDVILEESKRFTNSKKCYVAYVDPDNKDSVGISFSHMTEGCEMYANMGEARFKIKSDGTYGGLLGYSLDTGESFYIHNPVQHPAAHGLPKDHIPVSQFLSVPVKYQNNIIGQIVLGNPEKEYNSLDVDYADSVADIYGIALKNKLWIKI